MELPKDIISAFHSMSFSKLYQKYGTIQEGKVSVKYDYINRGGECRVYGVTFNNGIHTYKNLAVKIVYKMNQKEHNIMKLCSDNVENGTIMNFIRLYAFKCEGSGCVYLIERVDANMETWLNTSHSKDEWKSFMTQILYGLDFLYANNICHRDLKPKNILYKKLDRLTTITYKTYKLVTDFNTDYIETTNLKKPELNMSINNLNTKFDNDIKFNYDVEVTEDLKVYIEKWLS